MKKKTGGKKSFVSFSRMHPPIGFPPTDGGGIEEARTLPSIS